MRLVCLAFCLSLASIAAAQAQATDTKSVDVATKSIDAATGQASRVATLGTIHKDCRPGPTPEVKVITPPKNGTVAMLTGKAKSKASGRCPGVETDVIRVMYKSKDGFTGQDAFEFERRLANGQTKRTAVKVTVGAAKKDQDEPDEF
jgi:hypothetical protein